MHCSGLFLFLLLMMINLFDDNAWLSLRPLTFTRPVADLRIGILTIAEKWAKKSTELQPGYANLDTYAWVLFKNGKKDLSLEIANKAVNKAKEEKYSSGDYKSTTELIEKIGIVK